MKIRPAVFLAFLVSSLFLLIALQPALARKNEGKPVEKEFPASFDRVWSATLRTIQERGEPILTSDKTSGVIATDYRFEGKKERYKFTILLTAPGKDKTRVSVRCLVEGRLSFMLSRGPWNPKKSDGKREKQILDDIERNLKLLPGESH